MKKCLLSLCLILLLLSGCGTGTAASRQERLPFADHHLYAVAHLGYQNTDQLAVIARDYLDSDQLPIHYLSDGDYYLIIPRYPDMALALYQNDINTAASRLIYEQPQAGPFLLQCNVSDIFPDATVSLTRNGEQVEFSPFISLKDGSVDVGPAGLLLPVK